MFEIKKNFHKHIVTGPFTNCLTYETIDSLDLFVSIPFQQPTIPANTFYPQFRNMATVDRTQRFPCSFIIRFQVQKRSFTVSADDHVGKTAVKIKL